MQDATTEAAAAHLATLQTTQQVLNALREACTARHPGQHPCQDRDHQASLTCGMDILFGPTINGCWDSATSDPRWPNLRGTKLLQAQCSIISELGGLRRVCHGWMPSGLGLIAPQRHPAGSSHPLVHVDWPDSGGLLLRELIVAECRHCYYTGHPFASLWSLQPMAGWAYVCISSLGSAAHGIVVTYDAGKRWSLYR